MQEQTGRGRSPGQAGEPRERGVTTGPPDHRPILPVIFGLLLLALPLTGRAESLYVIDRLLVGVHETTARDSTILVVVPSDTQLEVLGHEGELVKVRTPDGQEGWVDGNYLTDELPARQVAAELESWKETRKQELKSAWAEVERLRAELEAAGKSDKQEPSRLAKVNSALKELQRLQEENRTLREQLAQREAETVAGAAAPDIAPEEPRAGIVRAVGYDNAPAKSLLETFSDHWFWVLLSMVLLLGLGLGMYLFDYRQRRRHGGFRI